jgi:GYF domain 2
MQAGWYVAQGGGARGPLTLDALVELFRRGEVPLTTQVWSPTEGRWLQPEESDELQLAISEEWARSRRAPGAVPLRVLPPPPGEPWFLPISPLAVGILGVATLGLYRLLWRYQHRVWALRRAGLPTSPIGLVYRYSFPLETELARAANQTGVPRGFDLLFSTGSTTEGFAEATGMSIFLCCPPLMLPLWVVGIFLNAQGDASVQETANRVNRVVAPGLPKPSVGWPEVAVLGVLSLIWLGVLAWIRTKLLV